MGKLWKILIVDDEPSNLEVLRGILSDAYVLAFARSGEQALESVRRHRPDLVLLDVMMPGIDGYEVCRRLKADRELCHTPVIFVTALNDNVDEARGFDVGAVDYLTKPVSPAVVRARVRNHIALVDQNVVLESLSIAGEFKDNETGAHVRRIGRYSEVVARRLGWADVGCRAIGMTAPLHDVGKIGIPDKIILKPGKLDEEEWALMRTHPERGAAIIGGKSSALMRMAVRISLSHHEKWDGSGYPYGVKGVDIPIESRIVAVADVYDALMSRRPYKPAWTEDAVIAHMAEQSGRHFDPEIISVFMNSIEEFASVRAAFPD